MADARARQIERTVDAVASAILALALFMSLKELGWQPGPAAATALAILGLCWRVLSSISIQSTHFDLPAFALSELSERELLLTDDERVGRPAELMLEDIAAHVGSGSRVVRLFDASAMPTAGELGARIDRHLHAHGSAVVADASQDLFDALAQLRRSLR